MNTLTGQHRSWLLASLILTLPLVATPSVSAADKDVNGRLEKVGTFNLLRVWGTAEEMGFAHGALVGLGFVQDLDRQLAADGWPEPKTYEQTIERLDQFIAFPETAKAELMGMLAGIKKAAGGKMPRLTSLDRDFGYGDLLYLNTTDALRAFGCSGFTAWGEKTGDLGVVATRNFDYPATKEQLEGQIILVRHPDQGHAFATITFPCYIGAFTGFNEHGVGTFMHDGTGPRHSSPQTRYTPVPVTLAQILQQSKPADAARVAEKMIGHTGVYPFSYMLRVVTPTLRTRNAAPVTVFRFDADGLSRNPVGSTYCITTNHYLKSDGTAVEQAHEWSVLRYKRISRRLNTTVTAETAWQALAEVVAQGSYPTLHSLVLYPDQKRLDLAYGTWNGQIQPAASHSPTSLTFERLFKAE